MDVPREPSRQDGLAVCELRNVRYPLLRLVHKNARSRVCTCACKRYFAAEPVWTLWIKGISVALSGIEQRFLEYPARILFIIPTEIWRL